MGLGTIVKSREQGARGSLSCQHKEKHSFAILPTTINSVRPSHGIAFLFSPQGHTMSDTRFASLKTDPRFRRPKKHHSKVILDDRFKDLLGDEKKSKRKKSTKQTAGACTSYNSPSTTR